MGSIESPAVVVDGGGDAEMEDKKPGDAATAKSKKLYAGVQAIGYRRDHMEVATLIFLLFGNISNAEDNYSAYKFRLSSSMR